jgi:hypothetical protein
VSEGTAQTEFWEVRPANWLVRRRWEQFVAGHRAEAARALLVLLKGPPFASPDIGRLRGRIALTPRGDERNYFRITDEWVIEFVMDTQLRTIKLTRIYQFPPPGTP